MKQITEEQALDIIKKNQNKSLIGLDINDETASFKASMRDHSFIYLSEASITESSSDEANRIGKLLQVIKPKIDSIGIKPVYFNIQILVSEDATLMMNEMNALQDFITGYGDVELKWSLSTVDNEAKTVKMQIITITE